MAKAGFCLSLSLLPLCSASTPHLALVPSEGPDPPLEEKQQQACDALLPGSSPDDIDMPWNGPTSDREVVFNLGGYKSGSTSINAAMKKLGLRTCKTAWNEIPGAGGLSFDLPSIANFQASPTDGDTPLHQGVRECDALGDAPWPFLFPTLMRAFPKAKFVLTRQPTCADWVYHVSGLWQSGAWGGVLLDQCWCDHAADRRPRARPKLAQQQTGCARVLR